MAIAQASTAHLSQRTLVPGPFSGYVPRLRSDKSSELVGGIFESHRSKSRRSGSASKKCSPGLEPLRWCDANVFKCFSQFLLHHWHIEMSQGRLPCSLAELLT